MKQLTVRPAKHICAIPACKSTETFKVSGSPNLLGGIYLCRDCIRTLAKLTGGKKESGKKI